MQNNRHFPPLPFTGRCAVTASYGNTELLQLPAVNPGKGIRPLGENDLIMGRFHREPTQLARIFSVLEKLRLQGSRRQHQGGKEDQTLHHTQK